MPGRAPQNLRKVKTRVLPGSLKIKNVVTTGSYDRLTGICITEMQQLFLCYKKFSFSEEACAIEIKNFHSCYNQHKSRIEAGQSKTYGKTSIEDINKLLQKYPERKKLD